MNNKILKITLHITSLFVVLLTLCSCSFLPMAVRTVRGIISKPYDETGSHPQEGSFGETHPYDMGKGLHIIRNPENYTQMVIDGSGNVIDSTLNPDLESVSLIENPQLGYAEYYYKTDFTAEVKVEAARDEGYEDFLIPIQKSKLYDKHGNEIKLPIEFSSALFATDRSIFLRDENKNYYENNLVEVFQNGDGTWSAEYDLMYENTLYYKEFVSDMGVKYINLYFSSELYNGDDKENRVVVTDDDLIIEREYKGYNVDNIINLAGKKIVQLEKLENDKIKYNFLDDKNNLVFEKDLDKGIPNDNESRIVTLVRDNKEFDFDFDTYSIVSEERDYVEKDTSDPIYLLKEKYEDIKNKIVDSDKKYIWGTTWYDKVNNKIRILAYYNEVFDEKTGYKEDADVYDEEGKFLGTMPKFGSCYEEIGYFFYNNNTVCDFDLNIIKTFDDDMYLSMTEKLDRIFFVERYDITDQYGDKSINEIKPFKVYDKDFNVLYDNVIKVYEYTLDDYFIVVDKDTTKFITCDNNKNLYVKKEIPRALDVSNWYSESDKKAFMDLKTEHFGILDKDLNIKVDNLKNAIDLKKDYFTYELGFSFGLMDYDGNIINKFSIFNTMGE